MSKAIPTVLPASPTPHSASERGRSSRSPGPRRAPANAPGAMDSAALRRAKDLGTELRAQGKWEEALAAFQEVVRAVPNEPVWRQKVAELLQRQGRTREAIAEYELAAESWVKRGWPLSAIALCKVILQLDPRHSRTQALLADLYARREQPRARAARREPGVATPPGLVRQRSPHAPTALPPEPKAIPFFSSLGREVFLEVLAGVERRECRPGELIVREGAPGDSMFIIVEGEVSVVRAGAEDERVTLATMSEGDLFGEMALVCQGPRLSSVVAAKETVLLEFSRERMEAIAARHPQLGEVIERLSQERLLANVLRSNPLFAGWSQELRRKVAEAFTPVSLPAGEEILSRGKPSHALYLLLRGQCAVFHPHVDGHETPYADMLEGDVFGEISLLRSKLATASVRARTPCLLLKLERAALDQLLPLHPILAKELQRLGAERMLRTTLLLCGRPIHLGDTRV